MSKQTRCLWNDKREATWIFLLLRAVDKQLFSNFLVFVLICLLKRRRQELEWLWKVYLTWDTWDLITELWCLNPGRAVFSERKREADRFHKQWKVGMVVPRVKVMSPFPPPAPLIRLSLQDLKKKKSCGGRFFSCFTRHLLMLCVKTENKCVDKDIQWGQPVPGLSNSSESFFPLGWNPIRSCL